MIGSSSALMAPVANILLGAPNEHLSSEDELRYGSRGVNMVRSKQGHLVRSRQRGAGGGVFDLIRDHTGLADQDAIAGSRSTPRDRAGEGRAASERQRARLGQPAGSSRTTSTEPKAVSFYLRSCAMPNRKISGSVGLIRTRRPAGSGRSRVSDKFPIAFLNFSSTSSWGTRS